MGLGASFSVFCFNVLGGSFEVLDVVEPLSTETKFPPPHQCLAATTAKAEGATNRLCRGLDGRKPVPK